MVAVLALAAPVAARAELVAPGIASGALAIAADGSPRVAFVEGAELMLASRTTSGWTTERVAALPGAGGLVAGIAVSPSGRVAVLAEARTGRWLVVYERGPRLRRLTSLLGPGVRIGRAGLALDRRGLPVVAYAEWRPSFDTFLRVVRFERGRYRARRVTRRGFPPSAIAPAAAPVVMRNGTMRVVEAYGGSGGSAAIDWVPQRTDWLGQFLYSSPLAALAGGVSAAAAADGSVHAAWTVGFPTLGTLSVVLARHGRLAESSLVLDHAVLAGLALTPAGPLLAATDVVDGADGILTAAVLRDPAGATLELDGAAASVAATPDGAAQVLLARDGALEWYAVPATAPRVALTAASAPGGVALSGTVVGANGGSVTLYRERPGADRVAIASAPLSPDGSFSAVDDAPGGPAFYRAVFADPATGLPAASLLRSAVGPG